jgi:hypothetical protein
LSSKGLSEIFSSCFFCCEVSVHLLQSDLELFLKFFFGIFAVRFLPFRLFGQTFGTLSRGRKGTIFFGKKNGGKMPAAGFLLSSLGVVLSSQHLPSHPAATGCGLLPVDQEPSFANRSVSAPYASPRQQTAETR